MPIQMRLPKFGFKNHNRVPYTVINVGRLEEIAEKHQLSKLDLATMASYNIVRKSDRVKILGNGELKAKLEVEAHAFSASAKQAIESAGGTATVAGGTATAAE